MVSAIARCYTSVPEAYLALFFPWQAPCPFCMQTQDELAFLAVTARAARYIFLLECSQLYPFLSECSQLYPFLSECSQLFISLSKCSQLYLRRDNFWVVWVDP